MNDKLIQIEGKFYQECSVAMLPTNKAAIKGQLYIPTDDGTYETAYTLAIRSKDSSDSFINKGQHLYFLSGEEIVEGDWFVTDGNTLHQCNKVLMGLLYSEGDYGRNSNGCKKVVATTDPELKIGWLNGRVSKTGEVFMTLPRPSNAFLEAFVREWNKGNKLVSVLVEYDLYITDRETDIVGDDNGPVYFNEYRPRIAPDNTITVRAIPEKKESWTTHEVKTLLYQFATDNDVLLMVTKEWIENNL